MADRVEQADRGQHRRGQRQDDAHKGDQVVGAVNDGGLLQLHGDALEVVLDDDHVEGAHRRGQPERPVGVAQMQHIDHHNVGGDHAAGEQHRDDDHVDKAVAALEVGAGQRVGYRAGDEHIDQRADHGDNHRIFQSAEHIALLEDVLVGVQRYILRDQEEGPLGQLALGRKGAGHHIDEGQHTGQRHQRNDDIQKNLHSLIAGGAGFQRTGGAHLVFLMGKGHCHCSTAPFFSTGRTRRTAWRSYWR